MPPSAPSGSWQALSEYKQINASPGCAGGCVYYVGVPCSVITVGTGMSCASHGMSGRKRA